MNNFSMSSTRSNEECIILVTTDTESSALIVKSSSSIPQNTADTSHTIGQTDRVLLAIAISKVPHYTTYVRIHLSGLFPLISFVVYMMCLQIVY